MKPWLVHLPDLDHAQRKHDTGAEVGGHLRRLAACTLLSSAQVLFAPTSETSREGSEHQKRKDGHQSGAQGRVWNGCGREHEACSQCRSCDGGKGRGRADLPCSQTEQRT